MVKKMESNIVDDSNEISSCIATIYIDNSKWTNFLNTSANKGKRKKFKTSFDDFISSELQKQGVLCWLKHTYNWFNKCTEYFWRGKFRCISKNCPLIYNCVIKQNNELGVKVEVDWENLLVSHIKLKKAVRCVGETRKNVARNLMAYGNSNIRQDHLLQNLIQNGRSVFLFRTLIF